MAVTPIDLMEYSSDSSVRLAYDVDGIVSQISGGTIRRLGTKIIHTFTIDDTLIAQSNVSVEILVVAAGGGGGKAESNVSGDGAGGGGAGGLIYNNSYSLQSGNYNVVIGSGGLGTTSGSYPNIPRGQNGGNSSINDLVAIGGGGGGSDNDDASGLNKGADGGSGGGAANRYSVSVYASSGTTGQGYAGGNAIDNTTSWRGGSGGGGAGGVGSTRTSGGGAAGGPGLVYSISGQSITYAIGGSGGSVNSNATGATASANTGSGGGGGGSNNGSGGNGASGIIIISYNIGANGSYISFEIYSNYISQYNLYNLKAIASQTISLNKKLFRNITSSINLSGYSYITYTIKSILTGSNVKLKFYNSNNYAIDSIPNIVSANTNQSVQVDISGVSDTDKNSINKIEIIIINADNYNELYIDNITAITSSENLALQVSKVVAYVVLKPPIALSISKVVAYAVIQPYINEEFGHLDPELGSDLNTGSSWHNAWRTITGGPTSSRITSGNCLVKIAKSPDPVSIGQAEWSGSLADITDRALQNDYYTQLLLRFDEAHNSSYTIDSSHRNQTVSCNNLLVTNAQYKLNSTSGYFNGSSTYISIPDTEFLNFGTDDWTIDFWFMPTGACSGLYPEIVSTQSGWNNGAIKITWDDTDRRLGISCFYDGSGRGWITSYQLNFNQWYHASYSRQKDYIYVYIDGILTLTCPISKTVAFDFCYGGSCRIGGGNWDGSNSYYLGYLSDLRISRKIIRWTSNFTPPTSPYPNISIPKIILQTAQNVTIDNCESNWTQSTDVTTSIRTDLYNQSYGALSVILGSNFTTGKIAYKTLSSQLDLSSYQKISFFYHVSANHAANIFKLCLCSDQSGNTIIDTFILPAVTDMSATIHLFPLTIDTGASLGSNINSIALYAISDPGTPTLILDNIIACKSGNSLSLNSLVSKNIQSDQWCKILFIIDNTVYISNYYGSNETVDTYQRQTYYTETTTDNYIQVSGSNGNLINYQAGYNKSTDEVDGETFYLGRTPSIGLHTNSKSNIRLRNLSFLNFGTGLYVSNSMNCDIEINNLAYNKTNYADQNSLYLNASHNNKISIKNLFYLSPNINIIDSSNNLINIKNTNLAITHSGYNNKIYASKYSESNIRQSNTFSNTKIYFQDFEIESQPENTLSSSTDNSKILNTRLYRDDSQNIITKYSGETISQTSIRNTNSGFAWKLYLSNNTDALTPLKLSVLKLAVQANKLVTISCYFYANSPLITGALCCERWQLNGIDDDAIAYTTQLNTWEQLQITFTPTQDGVVEIKAYAFGSATYSVYVDDVNFTQASS